MTEVSWADVDGLSVAYREQGVGPPLVLLHGWPLDNLDLAPAHVAGLSFGGGLALQQRRRRIRPPPGRRSKALGLGGAVRSRSQRPPGSAVPGGRGTRAVTSVPRSTRPTVRSTPQSQIRGPRAGTCRHSGERHAGVTAEAFTRGLRWAFTTPTVELPTRALQCYAGEYRQDDADRLPSGPAVQDLSHLEIRVDDDHLIVFGGSGLPEGEKLVATATDEFTFTGSIAGVARFHRDARSQVDGLSLVPSPLLADGAITLDRVR